MDNKLLQKLTEMWFSKTPTITEIKETNGTNQTFQVTYRLIAEDDAMRVFLFPAGTTNDGNADIWEKLRNDKRAQEGVDPEKSMFFTVFTTDEDADRFAAFAFKKITHKDGVGYPNPDANQRFITDPFIPLFQQLTFRKLHQIGYEISHIQTEADTYVQREPHVENMFLHNDFFDSPGLRIVATFSSCELTQSLLTLSRNGTTPSLDNYVSLKDSPVLFITEPMLETFFGSVMVIINLDTIEEAAKKDKRYEMFLPLSTATFGHFGMSMIQQIIRKAARDFVTNALDEKPVLGQWIPMSPVLMSSMTRYRNPHFISSMVF